VTGLATQRWGGGESPINPCQSSLTFGDPFSIHFNVIKSP
jgi:hypothetical protein